MAFPIFQRVIVNQTGDIVPSCVVTVLDEATGAPPAGGIFSDRNGTVPLGSGGVFTAAVDGAAEFYADPGEYRVTASDAGSGFSETLRFVVLAKTPSDVYSKSNILDTVSQSGGVPTGAIIQRGSNGNGEFVRFADGTQICTKTTTFTESTAGQRLDAPDWIYPVAFAVAPFFVDIGIYGGVSSGTVAWVAANNSQRKVSMWGATATSATVAEQLRIWAAVDQTFIAGETLSNVKLYAIGRWW